MNSVFRRSRGQAGLLALAMVLVAPAFASAQLLPNLPIRRERVTCDQENPQYRQIRQEYWGYYPTCWRKFPPGWGCPSPEAPNWEASKAANPIDLKPIATSGRGSNRPGSGMGNDPIKPTNPPESLPLPPDNGSLFDKDVKPPAADKPIPDPPSGPGALRSNPSGNAPLGSTDVSPTAMNSSPRRGRGFISGLMNGSR